MKKFLLALTILFLFLFLFTETASAQFPRQFGLVNINLGGRGGPVGWGPGWGWGPAWGGGTVIVTQPSQQLSLQPPSPPTASWYFCDNPQGYYPYVQQCPGGWRAVAPTPQ